MSYFSSSYYLPAAAFAATIVAAIPAFSQISQTGGVREARLSGQCQSIDDRENVTLSIGDARVRRGGVAKVTGVRQSIIVEAGGTVDIKGTAAIVYVMRGGTATVSGTRNQIVSEPGGNVVVVGTALMNIVELIEPKPHQNSTACR